jgi:predicted permease
MKILLEQFVLDLRYGLRGLARSRAFLLTTVMTLALGLAVIAVAFTVIDAYVFRPYAVRNPDELHQIGWRSRDSGGPSFRWKDYLELRDRTDLFGAAIVESTRFISSAGRPLKLALVSDNYFDSLAPKLSMGRALGRVDADGANEVLVLSDQAWDRIFSRSPSALGATVDLNGRPFVVIGIVGPAFAGLSDPPDAWVSLRTYAAVSSPDLVGPNQPAALEVFVRLNPQRSAVEVESALAPFMARVIDRQEGVRAAVSVHATPNALTVELAALLAPVFAAFGLVLVTACANVSNVMLARALARRREIAVRLSLGASRGRIVRQLFTEGVLIAALAGVAGVVCAGWIIKGASAAIWGIVPPSVAGLVRLAPMGIDHRVFLFALGLAALAPLLFALAPAVQVSRLALMDSLRDLGALRAGRLRAVLVGSQVMISTVLVILAVTLVRNGSSIEAIDLGYQTRGVVSINVRGENTALVPKLATVLGGDPRIAELAVTGGNPLFIRARDVAASPSDERAVRGTRYTFVSPAYFSLLGMPIERGRPFSEAEAGSAARVAIVSASTASRFWPGMDPIGRTIRIESAEGRPVEELPGYSSVTVVGVTRDVVSGLIVDGVDQGHIYLPAGPSDPHVSAVLVRGRTEADLRPEALGGLFRRAGPDPQVFEALPLAEMRDVQMFPLRAASWVGGLLGVIALILSVTGLYGVLSYTMGQRTREVGIRMALGATASTVVGLVVRQAVRLAGGGATSGVGVAFAAMWLLSSVIRLRTVSLLDGAAFAAGIVVVVAATALAAYQPARRATRVDPAQALRTDG